MPELYEHFIEAATPITRFVGHALAVSLGLVLLAFVFLIPIALINALDFAGLTELARYLEYIDHGLLYADLIFFALLLLVGSLELLASEAVRSVQRVQAIIRTK